MTHIRYLNGVPLATAYQFLLAYHRAHPPHQGVERAGGTKAAAAATKDRRLPPPRANLG